MLTFKSKPDGSLKTSGLKLIRILSFAVKSYDMAFALLKVIYSSISVLVAFVTSVFAILAYSTFSSASYSNSMLISLASFSLSDSVYASSLRFLR